ncbi:MAG: hypothetical protein IT431_05280 [Phycisphaerales bacterium]|nr:hypothetical protein [Phycisphaerales bacterium]
MQGRRGLRCGTRAWWALAAVGVLASWSAAVAQTALPDEYAARQIQRIGLLDLRMRPSPAPDDYLIAARLLESAAAFAPGDAELLRTRIRASWAAGDSARVDELTRELLTLDPRDTVAQLRLASARIARIQTVEDRLAAYARLLGPGGAGIDPAVRSRLALDAALLSRETGNFTAFTERLALATQLDPSNKESAALAWSAFGPLVETRAERVELLLNLLMSDPTDPNVHRQLALELAAVGAFEQAMRFHDMALGMYSIAGAPERLDFQIESTIIRWQVRGPSVVVEELNHLLGVMRSQAAQRIMQYQQAKMPIDSLSKPEDIMLGPIHNQIRLVAALAAEDEQTVGATIADMLSVFQMTMERAASIARLSSEEERLDQLAEVWGQVSQQLVAIAWVDLQNESLTEWTKRAAESVGPQSPVTLLLEAWRELRFGDPAVAVDLFPAIPFKTPVNDVGLGLSLEACGRADEAAEIYRKLALDYPMALAGAWARDKHRKLTGIDPLETPERVAVERLAASVPSWVDRMLSEPGSFMAMRADLLDDSLGATEAARVRVRVTNLAPIPLAVGGDRPLNSRLLLVPRLQIGTGDEFAGALPEVVELDCRLRLAPTESIDITVPASPGVTGWMAEVGALDAVRQRWRVLQGYSLDGMGVPEAGTLCLETDTPPLGRSPLIFARASGLELADALERAGERDLPEVLASIRARALLDPLAEYALATDDLRRIAAISAERYGSLPVVSRAMLLAVLPSARIAPGMEAFDAVALAERDPVLAPVALLTRVTGPDDPALTGWLGSEADGMGSFARALRDRLGTADAVSFGRLDAAGLRPSSLGQR